MLMAIGGSLFKGHIEWLTSMTYQAASGAGAKNMRELVAQMDSDRQRFTRDLTDPTSAILDLDQKVLETIQSILSHTEYFGAPLAGKRYSLDRQRA